MKKRFHSFLAPSLTSYLAFRQKLGYTSYASPSKMCRAKDLDDYVLFRHISSVEQLDEGFLVNWIHAIPQRAPGTKNSLLWFVRGFFNYLIRLGVARENPALRVRDLKTQPFRPYIFTLKEIHDLLNQAGRHRCQFHSCFLGATTETLIYLLYACGLRLGEALNLKIQDVDFEQKTLSLWKTKFHKERLVPFSDHTAEKLKAYLTLCQKNVSLGEPPDPFFIHPHGGYVTQGPLRFQFKEALKACGLAKPKGQQGPRLHDLRHAMAVHRLYKWYQEGSDILNKLPLLSTYMGHVNIEKTQVYLTITQALLREGDRRFQQMFGDLIKKTMKRAIRRQKKHS